jgi:MFS family permease
MNGGLKRRIGSSHMNASSYQTVTDTQSLRLGRDGQLLFLTRGLRLFAYGLISVVLVLYLKTIGLGNREIALLLSLTLVGDTIISLYITTKADRAGRKTMLMVGAGLMLFAGLLFAITDNFALLLIAAIIGVISPSGSEVGPFLSIEQSALAQIVSADRRVKIFAWYNLLGSFATAFGALAGGWLAQMLQSGGSSPFESYRAVVIGYAVFGILLLLFFLRLSGKVEIDKTKINAKADRFGLHHSKGTVLKLSALVSLDSFGGGFVVQSIMAYWFFVRFHTEPGTLGSIFFLANILAGVSALLAVRLAARIGLVKTMVYTHLPSNILLILVPFMPNFALALTMLLLRFSISQMDVPTRQAYVIAVVHPDERSAASGINGVARTIGNSLALLFTGPLLADMNSLGWIFIIAGTVKIVYDLLMFYNFTKVPPLEQGVK